MEPVLSKPSGDRMFDNYKDIFNARGAAYHQGMLEQPRAREQEFAAMLSLAGPRDGQVICDMPSGGGYLREFIDADVTLLCVETSRAFADRIQVSEKVRPVVGDLHAVPVDGGSVDTVLSLAGLHHVTNRPAVFGEMRRMLKRDGGSGRACLADVSKGSPEAVFLNGFVDQHNSMGHDGDFIDDRFRNDLARAGFRITSDAERRFHWTFDSEAGLARFCKLLFGLDRATEEQTLAAIREHVGYDHVDGRWRMNWALTFIEAAAA